MNEDVQKSTRKIPGIELDHDSFVYAVKILNVSTCIDARQT